MSSVVINGHTYSDDADPGTGLAAGGHRKRLIPLVQDIVATAAAVSTNALAAAAAVPAAETATSKAAAAVAAANQAVTAASTAAAVVTGVSTGRAALCPTLRLWPRMSRVLDPRTTFTRSSAAWRVGRGGVMVSAAAGAPRIDYSSLTLACRGLMIEPARTNLLKSSADHRTVAEGLVGSPWSVNAAGATMLTPASGTAPDSTNTLILVTEDSGVSSSRGRYQSLGSVAAGTWLTASIYVAAAPAGGRNIQFQLGNAGFGNVGQGIFFNPATGAIISTYGFSNTVVQVNEIAVGVYRLIVAAQTSVTGVVTVSYSPANGTALTYVSDGRPCFRVWHADCVSASSAGSIIPTTTATVSRAADTCSLAAGSWLKQGEGAIYVEFIRRFAVGSDETPRVMTLHDGTANNRITLQMSRVSSSSHLGAVIVVGGVDVAVSTTVAITPGAAVRALLAYKANDITLVVNGVVVWSSTSGAIPAGLTTLSVGSDSAGGNQLGGTVADLAYYPTRGSDAQWIAMTAN